MRDYLKLYVPIAVVVVVGFALASRYINPAPPRHVRIASGATQGAYAESALRYREILARDGITLEVVPTSGSMENLALLQAPRGGVDVAFVQGGTGSPDTPGLLSLGSVFFEPLWVFVRGAVPARYVSDLAGRRLALGVEGSGTRVLARQLLQASGVAEGPNFLAMGGDEAVQELLSGRVDAGFFVTARPQPQLDPLLRDKRFRLMSFAQADAFAQRFRFLSKVILPEGRLDLATNVPATDVTLLSPAATLVAREDLHPAIIDRLIQAAVEVHGGGQLFAEPGRFPSPRFVDLPISPVLGGDDGRALHGTAHPRRHAAPSAAALCASRVQMAGAPADLPLVRGAAGHRRAGSCGNRTGRARRGHAGTGQGRRGGREDPDSTRVRGKPLQSADAHPLHPPHASAREGDTAAGGAGRLDPSRVISLRRLTNPGSANPAPFPPVPTSRGTLCGMTAVSVAQFAAVLQDRENALVGDVRFDVRETEVAGA
ncbi:MAG: TRAP-type uncharacterized transport system, periplasmic component [candidate division NC10 bacterium]|nr:TRAP-type uncharacterized transport system, periplasmic component [candidate division NC10 bacterium]